MKDHLLLNTIIQKDVKLINKMSSGAGTLKVEGPAAQEWGIAFKVTMATKRALATWYCHTEGVQWNIYHKPNLPIRGWEEWEQNQQISQAVNSQWSTKIRKVKQSRAEICNHVSAPADQVATLHKPAWLGLNCWSANVVSRLTLPKLQCGHIKTTYCRARWYCNTAK